MVHHSIERFDSGFGGLSVDMVHSGVGRQTLFVVNPARLAAASWRLSDETKRSAPHSSAQATCSASSVREVFASRIVIDEPMTDAVKLTMSVSRTSSTRRCLAVSYCVRVSVRSRRRRLSADTISGTDSTLSPSVDASAHTVSTSSLPTSSMNRFANEEESRYAFTCPLL